MSKRRRMTFLGISAVVLAVLLAGILVTGGLHAGGIQEVMRDSVLHEHDRIALFGMSVNPGVIAAFTVTGLVFVLALLLRIFVIPRFKMVPGRLQLVLEEAVGFFDRLATSSSPRRHSFLGAYVFTAGVYIFISTLFELLGLQACTITGHSVTLPAPLSDINAAIAMGCMSYLVILSGGLVQNGIRGVGKALKDFSLPISMSFRLFGALLSGALVNELVYHYLSLSFVLPVIVAVLFTLLHALIQTYVLTMLTSLFYGEAAHAET